MSSSFFKRGSSSRGRQQQRQKRRADVNEEEVSSEEEDERVKVRTPPPSDEELETEQSKRIRLAESLLAKIDSTEIVDHDDKGGDEDDVDHQRPSAVRVQLRVATRAEIGDFWRFRSHRFSPTAVAISSDNKWLLSCSKDASITKYDVLRKRIVGNISPQKNITTRHHNQIFAIAISSDDRHFATGAADALIKIWLLDNLQFVRNFSGHRAPVTGLCFRLGSAQLFSCSRDRMVKVWDCEQMGYVDSLFGHEDAITSIDTLEKERCVTSGSRDRSIRLWKVADQSQLVFNGYTGCGSMDCVRMINEEHFISGSSDGSVSVWSMAKKKPVCFVREAHGRTDGEVNWIVSVAVRRFSDLAASGARGDESIRLWLIAVDYKQLTPLHSVIPCTGFVNDLRFSTNGNLLVAAIGQEHRFGRWWKEKSAKNSILIVPFSYGGEEENS